MAAESTAAQPPSTASWMHAESWVPEEPCITHARRAGDEMGCPSCSSAVGSLLRVLAATTGAKAVIEVGTGVGVSGAWLLSGMPSDGILTTIDIEPEHQRVARETFDEAGIPHGRARVINGRALEVLSRLTDGAYDLMVIDGDPLDLPGATAEATRLLRAGGVLVIVNALGDGRVADPSCRDAETTARREAAAMVRGTEDFTPALVTAGNGVIVAVRSASGS